MSEAVAADRCGHRPHTLRRSLFSDLVIFEPWLKPLERRARGEHIAVGVSPPDERPQSLGCDGSAHTTLVWEFNGGTSPKSEMSRSSCDFLWGLFRQPLDRLDGMLRPVPSQKFQLLVLECIRCLEKVLQLFVSAGGEVANVLEVGL